MKLSRLNIRGSLRTLGRFVEKDEFTAFICVVSVLKNTNESDANVPDEFSYVKNGWHTEESFLKSCKELVEMGYCKNVRDEVYSFTAKGQSILEAWANYDYKNKLSFPFS